MPRHSTQTDVAALPEAVFAALTDIGNWTAWDPELDATTAPAGPVVPGATFSLKPKGGPRIPMRVLEAEAPHRFADEARLPLARMRTLHEMTALPGGGTRVRLTVETRGLLALLWDRLVARPQIGGAAAHMRLLEAHIRS